MPELRSGATAASRPGLDCVAADARCALAFSRAALAALAALSRESRAAIDEVLTDEASRLAADRNPASRKARALVEDTRNLLRERHEPQAQALRALEQALVDMAAGLPDADTYARAETASLELIRCA